MARSKIRSTGPKKCRPQKMGDGPLLKESPFANVVLAVLGEISQQSGLAGEILTHFQSFIGTV